ncbi:SDR family oxidoreductase [Actinocrinis puniceicyclus]|uniref:SDR family oxidoreductase n=1 Tax=Actinocrinis puniceicyclus TaxID=977794 RepID=A0A8J8BAZ4_9ACTN|nr:SDR family oxidoreductase [Actinocrinis puniceicyclus]MBS2961581.1 SDR family oxidoreductase [Actinocrinis puniceicyclus]
MPAQHTVIIGGTAGIGLATAQQLVSDGYRVTVVGRDPERLKRALGELTEHAPDSRAVQGRSADQASRTDLDALFASVDAVDHLVVTAPGTGAVGALAELDPSTLTAAFESKFTAAANAVQAALPTLAKHGSITLVSAASAQCAMPGTAGLAAVNGAVETLVPTLALELAPIRVNAVSPGVVDTDWWNRVVPAEQRAAVLDGFTGSIPVGRIARPQEIADVIALLVRNGFMTGTVIPVDGGARLKPQAA